MMIMSRTTFKWTLLMRLILYGRIASDGILLPIMAKKVEAKFNTKLLLMFEMGIKICPKVKSKQDTTYQKSV